MSSSNNQSKNRLKNTWIPKQYLGAFKQGHRVSAREFIDDEFSYQLLERILDSNWTDEEAMKNLAYITKFNNEHHKNVVKAIKPKNKKAIKDQLHNTKALVKDCNDRENARNRDIISRNRDKIYSIFEEVYEGSDYLNESLDDENSFTTTNSRYAEEVNTLLYEDMLVDAIDNREEWEAFLQHVQRLDAKALAKLLRDKKAKRNDKKEKSKKTS